MKNLSSRLRFLALALTGFVVLALAGCGGKTEEPPVPGPLDGATEQKLAYGISMKIPQGWRVIGSTQENTPPSPELKKALNQKKKVEMLRMVRTEPNGQVCAEASMALIKSDSDQVMLPEHLARQASEQDLKEYAQILVEENRKEAAKQKRPVDLIELKFSRVTIGGQVGIMQSAIGKRPDGGTMHVLNYDIFLPDSVCILLTVKGQPEIPGLVEQMKATVESMAFIKQ